MKCWSKQLLLAEYVIEISSDKAKSLSTVASQEKVDQFKFFGSTQTMDGTSLKEVKIRLAQTHSILAVLWKKQSDKFSYED